MKIDPTTRQVTLDTEPCSCTFDERRKPGTEYARKTCPTCNGTRMGKRGKPGGCKGCFDGTVTDFERTVTCQRCNGSARIPETTCSRMPEDVRAQFWGITPIRFFLADRGISFNEYHLGIGTLYSCGDYGRAWEGMEQDREGTVRKITDEIRATSIQATTVMDKQQKLCNHVVVIVNRGGYSVRPSFKDDSTDLIRRANGEVAEAVAMMTQGVDSLSLAIYSEPNNVRTVEV